MPQPEVAPAAPPTTSPAQKLLLEFLRDHDASCPMCGYNVRALTRPVCPECKQELTLTVGVMRLRLGWLFVALAPGFFSGIAACFLLIPIVFSTVNNDPPPLLILGVDFFGWCSGVFAILLAVKRHRFLAQLRSRQRLIAIMIWIVHVTALGTFLLLARMFM